MNIGCVVFSPDGKTLASAAGVVGREGQALRGEFKLWDLDTKRDRATLSGHKLNLTSVCFSPDGTVLASASSDNTIRLWDVTTARELEALKGHTSGVDFICFSPDGRSLASGGVDRTIKMWPVTSPAKR